MSVRRDRVVRSKREELRETGGARKVSEVMGVGGLRKRNGGKEQ